MGDALCLLHTVRKLYDHLSDGLALYLLRVGEKDIDRRVAAQYDVRDDRAMCLLSIEDDTDLRILTVPEVHRLDRIGIAIPEDQTASDLCLRITEDLRYRTAFRDMTMVNDGDIITDGFDDGHLMRDDDDRDAHLLVDLLQKIEDLLRGLRIQRRGRLITEEHLRIRRERPGDRHTLLLSTRQLSRIVLHPVLEADELQQLHRPRLCLFLLDPCDLQRESNISKKIPLIQEVKLLEDHAHLATRLPDLLITHIPEGLSLEENLSARRDLQIIDTADQCRLARTGETDDTLYRALQNIQIDVIERIHVPTRGVEGLAHIHHPDDLITLCHTTSSRGRGFDVFHSPPLFNVHSLRLL